MKKCSFCGSFNENSSQYCNKCGASFNDDREYVEAEVIDDNYNSDSFLREENRLVNEYGARARAAFNLSIISVALCCCTITSIISFVLSIILLKDLSKMSNEIKNLETYRKIKNKTIIALVISSILVVMAIINAIDSTVNADKYDELYNSIMNDMMENMPNE